MIIKTPSTTGSHNHVHGFCSFFEMRNSSPKPAPTPVANKDYGMSRTGFTEHIYPEAFIAISEEWTPEQNQVTVRRRQWQPTPVLLPGKSHGWRSLVGCSPWGRKESDTTERLHFHFSLSCIGEGNGNPLQCSCQENPRDGRAWWGRTESDTTEVT